MADRLRRRSADAGAVEQPLQAAAGEAVR